MRPVTVQRRASPCTRLGRQIGRHARFPCSASRRAIGSSPPLTLKRLDRCRLDLYQTSAHRVCESTPSGPRGVCRTCGAGLLDPYNRTTALGCPSILVTDAHLGHLTGPNPFPLCSDGRPFVTLPIAGTLVVLALTWPAMTQAQPLPPTLITIPRVDAVPRLEDFLPGGSPPGVKVTDFRQRQPKDSRAGHAADLGLPLLRC